jgi:hypothetical protein
MARIKTKRRAKTPMTKKSKKTARRTIKKKAGRRRGRRSKLANVPLDQLMTELERRRDELLNQREELQRQVDQVDHELGIIGGSTRRGPGRPRSATTSPRGRGRRPSGKVTLAEALQAVLKGRTMGVSEAAEAVQKVGYKTRSKSFSTIVNMTLTQHPDKFKRVARGRYSAK